ncbi:MAG: hypothetical protein Kow0040_15490 [Thermogutta sp.]
MAEEVIVRVVNPRCEYRVDPVGIDSPHPRLSWQIVSPRRGEVQTAYQILVASSASALAEDRADLWDSGKVDSDRSIQVPYQGKPLTSGRACYWKVRVWDRDGRPSAWSPVARWTVGLMSAEDWKGRWIGKDEKEADSVLIRGVSWIWYGDDPKSPPPGKRWFRRRFELPETTAFRKAQLWVTADNFAQVFVNGQSVGRANNFRAAADLDVLGSLRPGKNVLAVEVENAGDSPNPAGLLVRLSVELDDGRTVLLLSDDTWKSSSQAADGWQGIDFDDGGWKSVAVLGEAGMAPWGDVSAPEADSRRLPARWLRKEFSLQKPVKQAFAYISGLGLSELYLNGEKIGDHVLSPGLTEYPKRVFYVTHEVTQQLRPGQNAVGVVLGNGRYFAPRLREPTLTLTYGFPKLLFQLDVEYEDGTRELIVSDGSWKLTAAGPILANNEYDGEEYDARLEMPGWNRAGFDDGKWQSAQLVEPPAGRLVAQNMEPIRVTETLRPKSVREVRPGMFIFDMGQNMVGWCRLHVEGPRGQVVQLRFAETIREDGSLYLDNIRGAKVTDRYVLKGTGREVWEPRFTYHGFRYVEVTGYPGRPDLDALEGRVVHDDMPQAGEWASSNELLNRIYRNVFWGVRGNYRSIPTDCPQRDERQGWLGDRSAESKGETFLFLNAPLYAKWLQDMADAQKENGSVPDVAPSYWPLYSDNVTWPSSLIIIPGTLIDQFDDREALACVYPAMVRWMDHMAGFLEDDIMPRDQYGDWCVPPEAPHLIHSQDPARQTAKAVLGTSYFYHCARLMARYARVLGRPEDASRFDALADRLERAFNRRFLAPQRDHYDNGSQTSSVLPLAFGLAPEADRPAIFRYLERKIVEETHEHVGTGLIGGQWLMRTLTRNGRADLAYKLATQKTYPSWGYMIEKDATTIWELWNGDTADPAMNSHNHVMLVGDLVIWMYEHLAGIASDPNRPGFKHVLMRPETPGDLAWVRAVHRGPYGEIASHWRGQAGRFEWDVVIPPNSSATLWVPVGTGEVLEGGQPVAQRDGIRFLRREGDRMVLEVGSGSYHFESGEGAASSAARDSAQAHSAFQAAPPNRPGDSDAVRLPLPVLPTGFAMEDETHPTSPAGIRLGCPDPAVIADDEGGYWIFSTGNGIPIWHSKDLKAWENVGRVFTEPVPSWAKRIIPGARNIWAPDIRFMNGKYHLYYSVSTFGSQHSVIGLAVNETLDISSPNYRWEDRGLVLESRPNRDDFNAIDPALFVDSDGKAYLFWGSYWTGIKAAPIDPTTGKFASNPPQITPVAARPGHNPPAIEGAYVIRRGDWYYLFVSYDSCCDGLRSTYNIRVGRAKAVLGPYVDREGRPMLEGHATLVLESSDRWRGTGHNSFLSTPQGDWLVHACYDAEAPRQGRILNVRPVQWVDGWPTAGEPINRS